MSFDIAITKTLGTFRIERAVVTRPGITVLFGRSGSGKTTILNIVAGLIKPDAGHVSVNGQVLFNRGRGINLPPERRRIGYVFQDGRLFPHRSVRANLLFGYRLTPPAERWMELDRAANFLGIAHLLERSPGSLSGGEAQRVAIGRALLSSPRALLMDEPLSSLDAGRREEILRVIERVRDDLALPILYVTHDPAEAGRLGAEIVDLN